MSGPCLRRREEEGLAGVQERPLSSHLDRICRSNLHRGRDGQKYAGRADLLLFVIHMRKKGDEEKGDGRELHRKEPGNAGEQWVPFLELLSATNTRSYKYPI